MPKLSKAEAPEALRPYLFYGLDLNYGNGEAEGPCVSCGAESRFYVSPDKGLYSCKKCGVEGNVYGFLANLHAASKRRTRESELLALSSERSIAPTILKQWGLAKSLLTGEWLLPAYNDKGGFSNLYRWISFKDPETGGTKRRLCGGPGLQHQLFGLHLIDPKRSEFLICEGPWDAMTLVQSLNAAKGTSVYREANVLAVPGCEVFREEWTYLFTGKKVSLLYDSDHPKTNKETGAKIPPAGWRGCLRAAAILSSAKAPPATVQVLKWGPEGFSRLLPSGTDIRDLLTGRVAIPEGDYSEVSGAGSEGSESVTEGLNGRKTTGKPLGSRLNALRWVLGRLTEPPPEALEKAARAVSSGAGKVAERGGVLEPTPCESYSELSKAWRKAMRWTDDLDNALACMLAVVASTQRRGDQLWFRIIGPPGCGKTRLCDALTSAPKYCYPLSHIKGFYSGYKESPGDDGEDYSLINRINGTTVVVKEGDTMLSNPALAELLSQLRDLYDGSSTASYKNIKEDRRYAGLRITMILAGTSSLRKLNRSNLGDRFIDCVIDRSDDEEEQDILQRVAYTALRSVRAESNGEVESQMDARLVEAYKLTAGYVAYLRSTVDKASNAIECSDEILQECIRLGRLVSYMRSRPDKKQEDGESETEVELPTRLTAQFIRLANCLAVVLNRKTVDDVVMERVRKVAKDTSRGMLWDVVVKLYDNPQGIGRIALGLKLGFTEERQKPLIDMLHFMHRIKIAIPDTSKTPKGIKGSKTHLWLLSPKVRELLGDVLR